MPQYIRKRDRALVSMSEAMDGTVVRDGYGVLMAKGESMSFSVNMADSARAVNDAAMLFDDAGQPATLYDAQTDQPVKLNADLIAAIQAEAARLGLPVKIYCNQVVGYVEHSTALQGKQ